MLGHNQRPQPRRGQCEHTARRCRRARPVAAMVPLPTREVPPVFHDAAVHGRLSPSRVSTGRRSAMRSMEVWPAGVHRGVGAGPNASHRSTGIVESLSGLDDLLMETSRQEGRCYLMNELYPADAASSQPDVWCDLGSGGGGCTTYVNVCPGKGSCTVHLTCGVNCPHETSFCLIHNL